jgi:hypothetical protein
MCTEHKENNWQVLKEFIGLVKEEQLCTSFAKELHNT